MATFWAKLKEGGRGGGREGMGGGDFVVLAGTEMQSQEKQGRALGWDMG